MGATKAWKDAKIKAKSSLAVDMTWLEMLKPAIFLPHLCHDDMLAFGGLVVTSQLNPMAASTKWIKSSWPGA